MSHIFVYTKRIYTDDTDYGGIVYHSNYLNYMDHARTEWLEHQGVSLAQLAEERNTFFAIRAADLTFFRPARISMQVEITCEVEEAAKHTLSIAHTARLKADTNHLFCRATVKLICVDNLIKLIDIPQDIVEKLK